MYISVRVKPVIHDGQHFVVTVLVVVLVVGHSKTVSLVTLYAALGGGGGGGGGDAGIAMTYINHDSYCYLHKMHMHAPCALDCALQ